MDVQWHGYGCMMHIAHERIKGMTMHVGQPYNGMTKHVGLTCIMHIQVMERKKTHAFKGLAPPGKNMLLNNQ